MGCWAAGLIGFAAGLAVSALWVLPLVRAAREVTAAMRELAKRPEL